MTYQLRGEDLAGFDLYGERNDDGTITLGHTEPKLTLPDFPDEVEVLGNVYTLECIRWNTRYDDGTEKPWSKEAAPDDPRRRICWGIYV